MAAKAEAAATLALYVQPGASRSEIVGFAPGPGGAEELKVRVRARPKEGEANQAVVALLAEALGVPKRAVTILSGETGRRKRVRVAGLSEDAARARLSSSR